jgi:hypothetical protein
MNTMEELNLACDANEPDSVATGSAQLVPLLKAVGTNTSLRMLSLRGNRLDDGIMGEIAAMVAENHGLRVLDLQNNLFTDGGAFVLARALLANDTLEELWIGGNRVGVFFQTQIENIMRRTYDGGFEVVTEMPAAAGMRVRRRQLDVSQLAMPVNQPIVSSVPNALPIAPVGFQNKVTPKRLIFSLIFLSSRSFPPCRLLRSELLLSLRPALWRNRRLQSFRRRSSP